MNIPPARVVFAITLEGTARKLVTVRSALTLNNTLPEAVEAKLENTFSYSGSKNITQQSSSFCCQFSFSLFFFFSFFHD